MSKNQTEKSLAVIHAVGTYYGVALSGGGASGHHTLIHARMDAEFTSANTEAARKRFTDELFPVDQPVEQPSEQPPASEEPIAYTFGFDTSALLVYRIEVPSVPEERLRSIIQLRMESILPLPVAEMATDWIRDEEAATLVATRKDQTQTFLDKVSKSQPGQIRLVSEGAARAWLELRPPEAADQAIFAWWHGDSFEILHAVDQKLRHRLALRIDTADLSGSNANGELETATTDICQLINRMGVAEGHPIPCVTSHSDKEPILSKLIEAGAPLSPATLTANALTENWTASDLHTFFSVIGLSLLESEGAAGFNLFKENYRSPSAARPHLSVRTLILPVVAVCCAIALHVWVAYRTDLAKWRTLQFEPEVEAKVVEHIREIELREQILAERPDLLRLLEAVTPEKQSNLELNRITFRRGQPVRLSGVAKNDGHLAFLEALLQQVDLSDVRMENPTYDKKKKETQFTLSFNFRHWTKPKASRLLPRP